MTDSPADILQEIAAERQRQISGEGYSSLHDDIEHQKGELARAAACYARMAAGMLTATPGYPPSKFTALQQWILKKLRWPWETELWKPSDPRRNLIKSAALLVAEIERIDRAIALAQQSGEGE